MPPIPVRSPANFTPTVAIAFGDSNGDTSLVRADAPLPVVASAVAAPAALSGTSSASGIVGPFTPVAGRPVVLALSGSWTGQVRLTRSTDGGATKLPVTAAGSAWAQFSTNCCEAVWEESDIAAQLYVDITLSSGTVIYRLAQ
jgi:hypothetical protein